MEENLNQSKLIGQMLKKLNLFMERTGLQLIYVLPLIVFLFVRYVVNFNGLYGQDAHEYLRYSNSLAHFFSTGACPGDYFWPVNYPLYGAILSFIVFSASFAMQIISTLSFCGLILYVSKIIRFYYPDSRVLKYYLFLFVLLSPSLIKASFFIMSDILAAFLLTTGFYYFLVFQKTNISKYEYLATFFFCSSFMTRYATAALLLLPSVLIMINLIRNRKIVPILISLIICGLCFLPNILVKQANPTEFVNHNWFVGWSLRNYFENYFITSAGFQTYKIINLLYAFYILVHPIFCFAALLLIAFSRRSTFNQTWMMGIPVLLYSLFIAGFPLQNSRFFIISFPLLAVILYPAFERLFLIARLKRAILYACIISVILFQTTIAIWTIRPIIKRNQLERAVNSFIKQYPNKTIYGFDIDISFRSYEISNKIVNLWYSKIDNFETGSLVIFNEKALEKQWEGKNPMINWNNIKNNYKLKLIKTFDSGWNLYEIIKRQ